MANDVLRPIRIEGNIAYIPLTKGYEAIIDAADVPLVDGVNWRSQVSRTSVYATRTVYEGPERKQRAVMLHQLILPPPPGCLVDHRDRNGLNNRRENLRIATYAENSFNRRCRTDNRLGVKGVSWSSRDGVFYASIRAGGKSRHLGTFRTIDEARAAYEKAAIAAHGEFARLA